MTKSLGLTLLELARPLAIAIVLVVPSKRSGSLHVFALAAFVAIFLIASRDLRDWIAAGCATAVNTLAQYAPYSYAGLILAALAVFLICLSRGSGTR